MEALKECLTSYYGRIYLAKTEVQDVVVRDVKWHHQSNVQACKGFSPKETGGRGVVPRELGHLSSHWAETFDPPTSPEILLPMEVVTVPCPPSKWSSSA